MRWRRCRKNKCARRGIKLAIGNTEAIAREDASGNGIVQTLMVQRMALGIQRLHLASVQVEPLRITSNDDT